MNYSKQFSDPAVLRCQRLIHHADSHSAEKSKLSSFISVMMTASIAILFLTMIPAAGVRAEVRLPAVFGDNMVLQRGKEIPVWGWAEPADTVTVTLDTLRVSTVTGLSGQWRTEFEIPEAGGPYEMSVICGDTLRYVNVMVGEIWVCSGQSNMQWTMRNLTGVEEDIASANIPNIRLFTVPRRSSETPLEDIDEPKPGWAVCSPDTVLSFSAVAFYFGKEIQAELRVPVGLIHSSWGGSVAEAWTPISAMESVPELEPIVENLDSLKQAYPKHKAEFDRKFTAFQQARRDSLTPIPMPLPPRGPGGHYYPSGLYNAMIHPLIPYGIAGVIWYQGESNAVRAYQYRTLFPALISSWRQEWDRGDFPFIYVQLANWETDTIPVEGGWGSWPELREAQLMTLSVPNTGMAVTIDIGEADNIHPNNKRDVGHRLALNALAVAYDRRIVRSGPIYTAWYRDGAAIRLRFRHVAQGLVAANMEPLAGFEIAGKDRIFHPAEARIEGTEVVVFSRDVPEPAAVRYAWDDNPTCNLYNSAGLPASPFRTDTWPGETEGRFIP